MTSNTIGAISAIASTGFNGFLAYAPSMTTHEPVLAGYVGIAVPMVLTACAFFAGVFFTTKAGTQ